MPLLSRSIPKEEGWGLAFCGVPIMRLFVWMMSCVMIDAASEVLLLSRIIDLDIHTGLSWPFSIGYRSRLFTSVSLTKT